MKILGKKFNVFCFCISKFAIAIMLQYCSCLTYWSPTKDNHHLENCFSSFLFFSFLTINTRIQHHSTSLIVNIRLYQGHSPHKRLLSVLEIFHVWLTRSSSQMSSSTEHCFLLILLHFLACKIKVITTFYSIWNIYALRHSQPDILPSLVM